MTRPATADYGIGKVDDALAQLDEKLETLRRYAAEGRLDSLTLAFRYLDDETSNEHRIDGLMYGHPESLALMIESQIRHAGAALDTLTADTQPTPKGELQ